MVWLVLHMMLKQGSAGTWQHAHWISRLCPTAACSPAQLDWASTQGLDARAWHVSSCCA